MTSTHVDVLNHVQMCRDNPCTTPPCFSNVLSIRIAWIALYARASWTNTMFGAMFLRFFLDPKKVEEKLTKITSSLSFFLLSKTIGITPGSHREVVTICYY